jgi:hypothetical protein
MKLIIVVLFIGGSIQNFQCNLLYCSVKHEKITMNYLSGLTKVYLVLLLFFLHSCATPLAPTGGPTDKEGPSIIRTVPKNLQTGVNSQRVEIEFSEYVNRNSLLSNLQIEPDIGIDYQLTWKKKTLFIDFDSPLPDSTTLLITLGNKVADTRNNAMGASEVIAFSTGDQIDTGGLIGKVLNAETGKGLEGREVFLFSYPYEVQQKALYRAETDTGGTFRFNYIRETEYSVVHFDDRNRNKIWDSSLESAHAFNARSVTIRNEVTDTLAAVYVMESDTVGPEVLGVGLLSSSRLRIRVSEALANEFTGQITLEAGFDENEFSATPLYISPADPSIVFAQSSKPLLQDSTYVLRVNGFEDLFGNAMEPFTQDLIGSGAADTTIQRFIGVRPKGVLGMRDSVELQYAAPIRNAAIIDSLRIIEGVVERESWSKGVVTSNRLVLYPDEEWLDGVDYQFLAWNPRTQRRVLAPFTISGPSNWGAIELVDMINPNDSVSFEPVTFELYGQQGRLLKRGQFVERIQLDSLSASTYSLRLYSDTNANGRWDAGSWLPYSKPESLIIRRSVTIRPGFSSTIRFSFN